MTSQFTLPEGYVWLQDLARETKTDIYSLVWLCEQEYMQAIRLGEHWAVKVIDKFQSRVGYKGYSNLHTNVVVRDLKSGGNITIDKIIGTYVEDDQVRIKQEDRRHHIEQLEVRLKIDRARDLMRYAWFIVAGGAVFFLVGIVLAWPLSTLLSFPAYYNAQTALGMAQAKGDGALLAEAKEVYSKALATILIFGVPFLLALLGLLIATAS